MDHFIYTYYLFSIYCLLLDNFELLIIQLIQRSNYKSAIPTLSSAFIFTTWLVSLASKIRFLLPWNVTNYLSDFVKFFIFPPFPPSATAADKLLDEINYNPVRSIESNNPATSASPCKARSERVLAPLRSEMDSPSKVSQLSPPEMLKHIGCWRTLCALPAGPNTVKLFSSQFIIFVFSVYSNSSQIIQYYKQVHFSISHTDFEASTPNLVFFSSCPGEQ